MGDWSNAQDMTQEAFIRAYVNLDQLRDPARFAAWLRRVAFGVAMNWLKAFRPGLFGQLEGKVDLDALESVAGLPEGERRQRDDWGFLYISLVDARQAAVAFLKNGSALPQGESRRAVEHAAAIYDSEVAMLREKGWGAPEQRGETLAAACELEADAIAQVQSALAAEVVGVTTAPETPGYASRGQAD